jgi:hypothetical protein
MKLAIILLLTFHGLIHAMGFAGTWDLAEFEASRTPTNFVSAEAGSSTARWLGILWMLALIAFLIAALLLLTGSPAWRPAALAAASISMIPVVLWWQNAPMGAVANGLVVVAVLFADQLELA